MTAEAKTASYTRRQTKGILTLGGVVDIFEASELYAHIKRAVADEKALTVQINLAQTERLDTSAIQLLFALRRALTAAGRACALDGASPALTRTLALAGFELSS